jgi:hypothetical protein
MYSLSVKPYSKRVGESGGFIQLILIIVIALLVLHYLNISLASLLGQASVREFFVYVWNTFKILWQDFLLLLNFIKGIITAGNGG